MDEERYHAAIEKLKTLARRAGVPIQELLDHLDLLAEVRAFEATRPGHPSGLEDRWLHRRVAIVSDVHGNRAGLDHVIADYEACGCTQVICLGDLVDGGPADEAVVQWAMGNDVVTVRGNHDEFTDHLELSDGSRGYLAALPETLEVAGIHFTHISPRPVKRKIRDRYEAWNVFDETDFRLAFVGHAHVSFIFGERSDESVAATEHRFEFNRPYSLDPEDRYLISVGSAGYTREKPLTLRYGILDLDEGTIELRSIEGPLLPLGILAGSQSSEQS